MRRVAASSPPPPNPARHRPLPVSACLRPLGRLPFPPASPLLPLTGIVPSSSRRSRMSVWAPLRPTAPSFLGLHSPATSKPFAPAPGTSLWRTDLQTVAPPDGRFGHDEPQGGPIRRGRGLSPPVILLSALRSSRNVHPSAHGVRPCCGGIPTKHGIKNSWDKGNCYCLRELPSYRMDEVKLLQVSKTPSWPFFPSECVLNFSWPQRFGERACAYQLQPGGLRASPAVSI